MPNNHKELLNVKYKANPIEAKQIQQLLIKNGYDWFNAQGNPQNLNEEYYAISKGTLFCYASKESYDEDEAAKELTLKQIKLILQPTLKILTEE